MTPTPIRRILCPIDASNPSIEASLQATAFAKWTGAAITVLYVAPAAAPVLEPISKEIQEFEATDTAIRRWVGTHFAAASEAGVSVDVVVRHGNPATEIIEFGDRLPADLIVLDTHRTGGFEHLVLGSVTEKVLRKAACPVLTVPPRGVATSRLPFSRVLCALDFSDWSLAALEFAMTASFGTGASLTLLHVLEWPWEEPPAPVFGELPPTEAAALSAYRARREQQALLRLDGLRPEGLRDRCHARVAHGRPYVELLRVANEEQADLLVLGVHGRNAFDVALFGSTTNQVVRRATCPVLTVRR